MLPEGAIVGVAVGVSVGKIPPPATVVGVGVPVADVPLILICCVHALLIAPLLSVNVTVEE